MSKRVSWNRYKGRLPDNTARVDRGTVWGNPYRLDDYSREESLKLFSLYLDSKLQQEPDFLAPLKGKDIACSCSLTVACHGDIIITKLTAIYGFGKLHETSPKQFSDSKQQHQLAKTQEWRKPQEVVPYKALKVQQPDLWWRAFVGNLGANRNRWPKVAAENEHLPQSSRKLTQRQVSDSDMCEWWLSGSIPYIQPHVGLYRLESLQPHVYRFLMQATSRNSTNEQRKAALYHLRQLAQIIL